MLEQLSRAALGLADLAIWVEPSITISALSGEPDNRILECAVAGKADQIVTGDKDLLRLGNFKGISVVSLREYLSDSG